MVALGSGAPLFPCSVCRAVRVGLAMGSAAAQQMSHEGPWAGPSLSRKGQLFRQLEIQGCGAPLEHRLQALPRCKRVDFAALLGAHLCESDKVVFKGENEPDRVAVTPIVALQPLQLCISL